MRLGELVGLDLTDLDLDLQEVKLHGQDRQERLVPLGSYAVEALKRYLSLTASQRNDDAVFLAQRNGRSIKRISREGVQRMLEAAYRTLFGPEHGLNVQSLRHTCAVHMTDAGANLIVIAKLLGHVSVSTTEVYGCCSIEYFKKQHRIAHPRA